MKSRGEVAIREFMQNWRENAYTQTLNNVPHIREEIQDRFAEIDEMDLSPREKRYQKAYRRAEIEKGYGELVSALYRMGDEYIPKKLDRLLDEEVEKKEKSLIKRIEKKAGKLIDVDDLHLGADGNLNGFVTGEKGRFEVRTVYAGGYNIQRLYFRVLVL